MGMADTLTPGSMRSSLCGFADGEGAGAGEGAGEGEGESGEACVKLSASGIMTATGTAANATHAHGMRSASDTSSRMDPAAQRRVPSCN